MYIILTGSERIIQTTLLVRCIIRLRILSNLACVFKSSSRARGPEIRNHDVGPHLWGLGKRK